MTIRILFSILLALTASVEVWSVGALFVRPLRSTDTYQAINISKYDARVKIQDHVATTYVDQTFRNELNQQVEATLIFPLPDGAVITELYYWFNGVRYKGSVREKQEAQAAYDGKIRKSMDPALLQELGDNIFKLQIAPINGISDVRVEITYTEILPFALGKSTYTHLLKTTGLSPKPLQRMSLTIDATTQTSWSLIESPSYLNTPAHKVQMLSEKVARITLGDETFTPTKNYKLELTSKRTGVDISTLTYVPVPSDSFGTKPFFLTWVVPPDTGHVEVPRSVTFVADVSSSMTQQRMDQMRIAMTSFIEQLAPHDKFNIVTFSTNVSTFSDGLVQATSENIDLARVFINQMRALGLTNISEALRVAIQQDYSTETANAVVFITDGQPSFGEQNEAAIIDSLKKWNHMNVMINPITIGEESSIALMKKIAVMSGGYLTEIMRDDSIAVIIRDHLRRMAMPNITDMRLDYGELTTYDVEPRELANVSVGGRVIQAGLYERGGSYPVSLTGKILGVGFTLRNNVVFGDSANSNKAVARLWARARVNALLDQIAKYGEKKELVNAVIQLSIQFSILTKYTALYADPDDKSTDVDNSCERPIEAVRVAVTPHPATPNSSISVNIPDALAGQMMNIQIVDIYGRVVSELALSAVSHGIWTMPLARFDLQAGTYIVVLKIGNTTTTHSIIVAEGTQR